MILDGWSQIFSMKSTQKGNAQGSTVPAKAMDFGLGFEVQLSMLKLERFTETYWFRRNHTVAPVVSCHHMSFLKAE